jgi:hypothetical protein
MTSRPRWKNPTVTDSSAAIAKEAGMASCDRPGDGWTVVLRRQPVRIVEGRLGGCYTDVFELICCDCGDDPHLDYREVSPELQRVRGPYPIAEGIAAYKRHLGVHRQPAHAAHGGR